MFKGIQLGDIAQPSWAGYRQYTDGEVEGAILRGIASIQRMSASPDHAWVSQDTYDRLVAALTSSSSASVTIATEVGIAAAVALGGFCWLIARRNQLAREADDETFISLVSQWLATIWAQFLSAIANKPKELTE